MAIQTEPEYSNYVAYLFLKHFMAPMAVSYTHLDVYKRQSYYFLLEIRLIKKRCR